jgi:phage regulator Rha-like protein
MQDLSIQLIADNQIVYADSRIVAPKFKITHHAMLKSISAHWDKFSDAGCVKRTDRPSGNGRSNAYVLLTRRGIMLLPAICKLTPATLAFQTALIDKFEEMEQALKSPRQITTGSEITGDLMIKMGMRMKELETEVLRLDGTPGTYKYEVENAELFTIDQASQMVMFGKPPKVPGPMDTQDFVYWLIEAVRLLKGYRNPIPRKRKYIDCLWLVVKNEYRSDKAGTKQVVYFTRAGLEKVQAVVDGDWSGL